MTTRDVFTQEEWERRRAGKFVADGATPKEWPKDVRAITLGGLSFFGIDSRTSELHFDGQKLVTEKRWSNQERLIAWIGVALAAIGVAATVVQAWFAAFPHPPVP